MNQLLPDIEIKPIQVVPSEPATGATFEYHTLFGFLNCHNLLRDLIHYTLIMSYRKL